MKTFIQKVAWFTLFVGAPVSLFFAGVSPRLLGHPHGYSDESRNPAITVKFQPVENSTDEQALFYRKGYLGNLTLTREDSRILKRALRTGGFIVEDSCY